MKLFIYMSPIMIMFISFTVMAALPLYWAVGGILLIFQTYLGRKFYYKATEPIPEPEKKEPEEKKGSEKNKEPEKKKGSEKKKD